MGLTLEGPLQKSDSEYQVQFYGMNGMDAFVAKPISIPVLLRTMEDALQGHFDRPSEPGPSGLAARA